MTLIMSPWSHMRWPQRPIQAIGSFADLKGNSSLVAQSVPREALGNKVVKRSLRSDLFLMNVLGAD
jgi:hypothetical protein